MSGRKSRSKGQRREREGAEVLTELGLGTWRRTAQRRGINTGDLECDEEPKLHCEVKGELKSRALEKAMAQAVDDAQPTQCPFVLHRRNGTEWLFTVRASDMWFFALLVTKLMGMKSRC